MRFVKRLLKYVLFFVLGAITCALMSITALSYFAIDQLSKATAPATKPVKKMPVAKATMLPNLPLAPGEKGTDQEVNPNLRELTHIGHTYVHELNLFDELAATLAQKNLPEICSVLCNPTFMDRELLTNERTNYLVRFYQQEGARAHSDPVFRMKLEEIGILSELFPVSFRKVLVQIHEAKAESTTDKLALAVQLQTAVVREISSLNDRIDDAKRGNERLKILRELTRSCEKGLKSRKQVVSECHSELGN
ncbi:MAG: hypothetical protein OM95_01750 [Bdellovibrio sp. ArHS]|uniref:hypothetical protein n=1 Tax=Bdellovibrio sp. ArHS TaxID=1569284 RepID=UPI0005823B51|nr:hypothetical protein [Bdellovibrio sp. ArHS]KHD89813.1 MAG: hypothetical protein OM95_01750 [Bdellovibrio sp. ArHS]